MPLRLLSFTNKGITSLAWLGCNERIRSVDHTYLIVVTHIQRHSESTLAPPQTTNTRECTYGPTY